MKKIILVVILLSIISSNICSVFAHEMFEIEGVYKKFRWNEVYTDAANCKYSYLRVNNDSITSMGYSWYNTAYYGGLYEWNWHSAGKVKAVDHSYNGSRVDFIVRDPWPFESTTIARMIAYANGVPWCIEKTGKYNTACTNTTVSYAIVWMNPNPLDENRNPYTTAEKNYVISHELGHATGLGHPVHGYNWPDLDTESVMFKAVRGQSWSNIFRPQSHDIGDLIIKY